VVPEPVLCATTMMVAATAPAMTYGQGVCQKDLLVVPPFDAEAARGANDNRVVGWIGTAIDG
jgi:hypothetical protein